MIFLAPPVGVLHAAMAAEQAACFETATAPASPALRMVTVLVEGVTQKLIGNISTCVFHPVVPLAACIGHRL